MDRRFDRRRRARSPTRRSTRCRSAPWQTGAMATRPA